ncbi:hypothetical protein F0919_12895 [Taibaiella lutea]|uniref:Uncharacterized protein n=1 Tax=Taibaiella lutea TaxID=2608001 RepID=A0A5M6CEM1_9BACT|nr:hypothetical protein [Taibaiella lutea]KAA5533433.1 hypothetical protein F0919_12895 [Taibaiella lutea]
MKYETTEFLKMKVNDLIHEIRETDTRYQHWYHKGCYQLASLYKKKLERLFTELSDANTSFLKEKTTDQLNRISTCVLLSDMGISYNEADGLIYI